MDVELEEVAKLLFTEEIPELWKDSDEFSKYIVHLSSCGVEKLGKEGAHLREERLAILDQTRDLAYSNYKTFIHTADCSRTIFKDFTSVENHLEGLSSCLPNLRGSVEQFLATSRNLSQSRHLTSLTLTKHTQLLEVLELPQLMDTCVRNGYYDEALEILAYVRRLERKHTDIHIIAGIVTEVQSGTRLMLNQLLAQLRSPLALPQCLKVIGLLRRLDVFTEPELRLKFLQARDAWFMGILKSIPKEDPYQHIIKIVEASRVHLFDIVTQYRAIFSDDDTRFSLGDPEVNEQAIFHGWILHKVNHFIKLVAKDLERGVGTNLESVLAQCMFFGQSFSRIGADFRNLLIPLFQKAALVQCEKDIRVANIKFDETLSSFSLMEAPSMSSSAYMTETQDRTRPPLTLMEFPPLAHYMNGLVAAFNTLRQCCPVSSLPEVIGLLEQSLTKVIGALLELHRLESSGFTAKEEAAFQRLCSVVAEGVLPHVNACLRLLYPLQHISLITGEPVAKLQRENFGQLDLEDLLEPIKGLLPTKEETFLTTSESLQQDIIISEGLQQNILPTKEETLTTTTSEDLQQDIATSKSLQENISTSETLQQDVTTSKGLQQDVTTSESLQQDITGSEEVGFQETDVLPKDLVAGMENVTIVEDPAPDMFASGLVREKTALPENDGDILRDEASSHGGQIPEVLSENPSDIVTEKTQSNESDNPQTLPGLAVDLSIDIPVAESRADQEIQTDIAVSKQPFEGVVDTSISMDEQTSQDTLQHMSQHPPLTTANQASIPKFCLPVESEQEDISEQDSNKMSEIPL